MTAMTPEMVMTIGRHALEMTLLLAAPLLLVALVVGLIVGVFQAATQINEMTLSFIPKLLAMAAALVFPGPGCCSSSSATRASSSKAFPALVGLRRLITLTTGQLEAWLGQLFWPFMRIGACFMVAPVFGARFVPARMRIVLAGRDDRAGRADDPAPAHHAVLAAGHRRHVPAGADRRGARLRAADRVRRVGAGRPAARQQHGPVVRVQRGSDARQRHAGARPALRCS